ncbi:MAG: cell division protein FtsQ/DivIB [Lachnospiraceae bacterium]|nr:cell division protein FtsQ/DivIB [Lachnospiraceae bacterium]
MADTKALDRIDFVSDYKDTKLLKITLTFLVLLILICVAVIVIKLEFTITSVSVLGNDHYTKEEIADMVMGSDIEKNSIFLYLKNRFGKSEPVPFVEQMDVEIDSPTSVTITVYEKAVAGYVEYLGRFLYFDKDGIVVESSADKVDDIPFVTGLSFDHMALHEKLPVENESVFKLILNLTQLLTKYGISVDRIYFDKNYNITLYFGNVGVMIGNSDYIDEKINKLQFLLPKLDGYSGNLHMENFDGEGDKFSFERKY